MKFRSGPLLLIRTMLFYFCSNDLQIYYFLLKNQAFLKIKNNCRNNQIIIFAEKLNTIIMIQRIQSVFLFLAAVFSGVLFFTPIAAFEHGTDLMRLTVFNVQNQTADQFFSSAYTLPLLITALLMLIVPVLTIFLYKKRELQLKLSSLNVFLNAILCGLIFLYYSSNIQKTIASETITYLFGTYVPLINMVLSILAMRWIKKDIELIKSIDRLR